MVHLAVSNAAKRPRQQEAEAEAPLPLPLMAVKDYYNMLEVKPGATQADIKKAYRRLALRYHPDTNPGNRDADAWFRELQEAYRTLTTTSLREAYHQERWLQQSMGQKLEAAAPLTPDRILAEARQLHQQVSLLDHFRMDHMALQQSLLHAVNTEKLEVLQKQPDVRQHAELASLIMAASLPLDHRLQKQVFAQMLKLAKNNPTLHQVIERERYERLRHYWWEKNQWWLLLGGTTLLCIIIYLASKG